MLLAWWVIISLTRPYWRLYCLDRRKKVAVSELLTAALYVYVMIAWFLILTYEEEKAALNPSVLEKMLFFHQVFVGSNWNLREIDVKHFCRDPTLFRNICWVARAYWTCLSYCVLLLHTPNFLYILKRQAFGSAGLPETESSHYRIACRRSLYVQLSIYWDLYLEVFSIAMLRLPCCVVVWNA